MPAGIGYGMGSGFGPAPMPTAPTQQDQAMGEIVAMLKGGQVGAERFVELLSVLSSGLLGQNVQAADQPAPADPNSIAGLLGG
jgi:hypothetical protein